MARIYSPPKRGGNVKCRPRRFGGEVPNAPVIARHFSAEAISAGTEIATQELAVSETRFFASLRMTGSEGSRGTGSNPRR